MASCSSLLKDVYREKWTIILGFSLKQALRSLSNIHKFAILTSLVRDPHPIFLSGKQKKRRCRLKAKKAHLLAKWTNLRALGKNKKLEGSKVFS